MKLFTIFLLFILFVITIGAPMGGEDGFEVFEINSNSDERELMIHEVDVDFDGESERIFCGKHDASGASINISSNLLNTSIPNQRGEISNYLQNQLLGRYQLELLSNGLPSLGVDVSVDDDDSESFDGILNLPKANLEAIEKLLQDTVIGGKFIGDTGSDTLNRLVQEAVSNGIPLTDMFEIRDGVVRSKA